MKSDQDLLAVAGQRLLRVSRAAQTSRGRFEPANQLFDSFVDSVEALLVRYLGREETLVADILRVCLGADALHDTHAMLFAYLYDDGGFGVPAGPDGGGPDRRPRPFEAFVETLRRIRDLRSLVAGISQGSIAGLLGGSVSYGRFYRIRGAMGASASDLDLLVVVDGPEELNGLVDLLAEHPLVAEPDVKRLRRAAHLYLGAYHADEPLELVARLAMWQGQQDPIFLAPGYDPNYELSLHVITYNALQQLLAEDGPDYMTSLRTHPGSTTTNPDNVNVFTSFTGEGILEPRLITGSAEMGFVERQKVREFVRLPDGSIQRFYGRFFHNLIPKAEVLWTDASLQDMLASLADRVERALNEERRGRHEFLSLSVAHPRRGHFPWYLRDFLNGSRRPLVVRSDLVSL